MKHKYSAYYIAVKDDICLEESVAEMFRQGVNRVLIVSPTTYWSTGECQAKADFDAIAAIATRNNAELNTVYLKAPLFKDNALYTEALYRNYAVDLLEQDSSIDYNLTVDSDELWLPGTLEHVDRIIDSGTDRVDLPATPVIGVPGLPIAGAKDSMLVATRRSVRFTWGRATSTELNVKRGTVPVLHFSATRKTVADVVEKMRKSAHYTDPTYDFEGWIRNVLPHVCVGMKNVHMYLHGDNIWPAVRAWTETELSHLPASLHTYLKK